MELRFFQGAFFIGLGLAALSLIFQIQFLMSSLLYIGAVHVIGLAFLGSRLAPPYIPLAIDTLHKAGFLHTLFALGAAVITSGSIIASNTFTAESLSHVLFPMGAALVPHALGLMAGQALQMRHANPEEEETVQIRELRELHQKRKELLDQLVASLTVERALYENIRDELIKQQNIIVTMTNPLQKLKDALQKMLTDMEDYCARR